ncbi:MAG: hypothetical protein FJ027_14250 [Candidatus Rokubacteria bacterium]|nr:hypothetical protein [Candidatus Rokubacteria bacterium]
MGAIVLATCAAWPEASTSDRELMAALRARGHEVAAAPWNAAFTPFEGALAVVVRSTWDYHLTPDAYDAWLGRLDPARTFNPPALIRWNLSKGHVLDLARRGAVVPRTREAAAEPDAVAAALDALGLHEGGDQAARRRQRHGRRARAPGRRSGRSRAHARGDAVDAPARAGFLPAIAHGELAGVFFDGVFSHGLRRTPVPGEFRINSQYGGTMAAAELSAAVVEKMAAVLALLPERPLYARVDGVVDDDRFVVMEVEVNEPGLGLHLAPGAGERFAGALLSRLGR